MLKNKQYKWCAYGLCGKRLGKIIENNIGSVRIQYCEGQHYSPELWEDKKCYVVKFASIIDAMKYVIDYNRHETSTDKLLDYMCSDFKEAKKNRKKVEKMI